MTVPQTVPQPIPPGHVAVIRVLRERRRRDRRTRAECAWRFLQLLDAGCDPVNAALLAWQALVDVGEVVAALEHGATQEQAVRIFF